MSENAGWLTAWARAQAAQDQLVELRQRILAELERRDQAVKEAVDGGAPMPRLAQALGICVGSVYRILGTVA